MTMWIVTCSACGTYKLERVSRPTTCQKNRRISERCERRCGNTLTEVKKEHR